MEILGRVHNGVVVFEGEPPLPEGTPVMISSLANTPQGQPPAQPVEFPLVRSQQPGSLDLTSDTIASLLAEDDAAS